MAMIDKARQMYCRKKKSVREIVLWLQWKARSGGPNAINWLLRSPRGLSGHCHGDSSRPVSLTAAMNFGVATLELQIHLPPGKGQDSAGSETESLPSGASHDGAENCAQGGIANR
jgi:hypothetical protein